MISLPNFTCLTPMLHDPSSDQKWKNIFSELPSCFPFTSHYLEKSGIKIITSEDLQIPLNICCNLHTVSCQHAEMWTCQIEYKKQKWHFYEVQQVYKSGWHQEIGYQIGLENFKFELCNSKVQISMKNCVMNGIGTYL